MNVAELINNPERMNRDTLFELRSLLASHPYFQTVRLLMLQNLYLLHDPSFDEELRRSAVYITDRRTLFNIVEGTHYKWSRAEKPQQEAPAGDRTIALIDTFLDSIPENPEEKKEKRRPTPADATIDYVAYLLESEENEKEEATKATPKMQGQNLIDNFLEKEQGRFALSDFRDTDDKEEDSDDDRSNKSTPAIQAAENNEEEYFTETLARIYIKQGHYQKALEIIQRLSTKFPKKNVYFADQIRFLEKLIINSNKTKK